MWGSLLKMVAGGAKKGLKAVATGNAQAQLGLQSPYVPSMMVRLGRFFYFTSGAWIGATFYSGYVNMRTEPGSGPALILPGTKKVIGLPNRPPPQANWTQTASSGGGSQMGSSASAPGGTKAGGFLPKSATYQPGRKDQGRDGRTDPGGPLIAPGAGVVIAVLSDPRGFGPDYPVVKFSSGPYQGRILYLGHTHSALRVNQRFSPNQVLSYTGKTPVGNASVAGWFEVGYADKGYPGPGNQPAPFK